MPSQPHRLPFFLYGTLRPGGGNHARHLSGRCEDVRAAVLEGVALHDGPGYPYAVRAPGCRVLGDLIVIHPAFYPQVTAQLDRLEGIRPDGSGEYVRVPMTVTAAGDEQLQAWVYLAGPAVEAALRSHPAVIPSGDWFRRGRING